MAGECHGAGDVRGFGRSTGAERRAQIDPAGVAVLTAQPHTQRGGEGRFGHPGVGRRVGAGRMPVAYYITAMLFILFDIEMVFLYPFAVSADALGMFGLVEIVLFIATVGFAYAYVWRRGGLDWN